MLITLYSQITTKPHPSPAPCVPQVFTKHYAKVIDHDVTVKEAVCITSDIAVLGNASVRGGDTCITGNVLVAGDVWVKGSPCITGDAIILGNAKVEGQVRPVLLLECTFVAASCALSPV
jgi:predicted acyltransferase (DUF342 family)